MNGQGFEGMLYNPMFAMGVGLLSGRDRGNTFATGAQQALRNGLLVGEGLRRNQLVDEQRKSAELTRELQGMKLGAMKTLSEQVSAPAMQAAPPGPYTPGVAPQGAPGGGMLNLQDPQVQGALLTLDPMGMVGRMYPEPQDPTSMMQNVEAMGHAPGTPGYQQALHAAVMRPPMQVRMGDEVRSVGDQFKYDYAMSQGTSIKDAAIAAPNVRRQTAQGKSLLRDLVRGGDPTGAYLPKKAEAARWLGMDPEMVGSYQMFNTMAGQKVMDTISQTKGGVSEREMDFFQKINYGADKEPFTNYALMEIADRKAARAQDQARYYSRYIAEGNDPVMFEQWYLANHDPFPEFDLDQLRRQYRVDIMGEEPAAEETRGDLVNKGYINR